MYLPFKKELDMYPVESWLSSPVGRAAAFMPCVSSLLNGRAVEFFDQKIREKARTVLQSADGTGGVEPLPPEEQTAQCIQWIHLKNHYLLGSAFAFLVCGAILIQRLSGPQEVKLGILAWFPKVLQPSWPRFQKVSSVSIPLFLGCAVREMYRVEKNEQLIARLQSDPDLTAVFEGLN